MCSNANRNQFGLCPNCGSQIRPAQVIIEYETDTATRAYADCPGCREIVHPE